jgi:hypothetical protein
MRTTFTSTFVSCWPRPNVIAWLGQSRGSLMLDDGRPGSFNWRAVPGHAWHGLGLPFGAARHWLDEMVSSGCGRAFRRLEMDDKQLTFISAAGRATPSMDTTQ